MRAGALDRRIVIQRAALAPDAAGDPMPSWADLVTVWASARPAPGVERLQSAEIAATAPMVFRIRWSSAVSDVSPADRIAYGGRDWNIVSVVEIGRREGLEIAATARAD
ncbi:phage head closure protein [Sphingomonas montanisoli]|uniref:Phage head closure protein n=1 Tax=Sphingomonas montanisoli TaxID=2606412 RepID=A0A5D9C4V2_9SPHN|nr:phage head closure protein [Sphingomonas montanisoli]TZG26503.1 phage head closure protein [Sphingomonas montanisoli]